MNNKPLTVAELIEGLKKMPPDAQVLMRDGDHDDITGVWSARETEGAVILDWTDEFMVGDFPPESVLAGDVTFKEPVKPDPSDPIYREAVRFSGVIEKTIMSGSPYLDALNPGPFKP